MNGNVARVAELFAVDGAVVSCELCGCGHINKTYMAVTDRGSRYILQKINNAVFKDVAGLMTNIEAVTAHLQRQTADPRAVLQLVRSKNGRSWLRHSDDTCWRMFDYVEDSICLQLPETPADIYASAAAFGSFQQKLQDFPADTLVETIPNFHNTRDRYRIFRETVEKDPMGRAEGVRAEIEFALQRQEEAATLVDLLEAGKLPLRVTHNDTKLNNVMLDAKTRKALCVIDLDTVMPGLSAYDFGDSIRFGAASAAEDEQDLDKMEMRLDLYETFTKGFLENFPGLTELEVQMLPMGAKIMTLECGVRFLTDYLDGDHYFTIHREGQNLDRCRTQFKLVADMEAKWDRMHQIVKEIAG